RTKEEALLALNPSGTAPPLVYSEIT
ncbi:MAG: hypothetical protein QOG89_609, partial [Thermomicrobiales bacterium]|nr:hypothetical protein [Thermomicrobiales bacterium]